MPLTSKRISLPFLSARRLACLLREQSGTTFIEVLVALALLGIIAVALLSGMATNASMTANEKNTAGGLAQTQMEWVKQLDYTDNATSYAATAIPGHHDYLGYAAVISAAQLHIPDDGIQKITVTIRHYDEEVFTLEGYKVAR